MRYLQTLHNQLIPAFNRYVDAFEEVLNDINDFVDKQLDSDFTTKIIIVGIIATPIIGSFFFLAIIMFTS